MTLREFLDTFVVQEPVFTIDAGNDGAFCDAIVYAWPEVIEMINTFIDDTYDDDDNYDIIEDVLLSILYDYGMETDLYDDYIQNIELSCIANCSELNLDDFYSCLEVIGFDIFNRKLRFVCNYIGNRELICGEDGKWYFKIKGRQ